MAEINIRGRRIPLLYTTMEMLTIQQEIAPIGLAMAMVVGKNLEDPEDTSKYAGREHLEALGKMIKILGNAGLEEAGETADLTEKAVLRGLPTDRIIEAVNACLEAMNEGMHSEYPEKKKDGRVDVTLEEMEKKREEGK